ncbi:MAG: energy-coupling factor ABC transporter permease [archaeon]|nr:energy-coupling factor ABC transporter permease [archaeon]
MEGYLEPVWCIVWFAIMIPFVVIGVKKIVQIFREHPEQKMTVALSGAFIFLISSLKLPSVTGSSAHPTGTALAVVLYGVSVCSVLSAIVLILQALLLAHGGLTTLGANCVSMGIIGPLIGLLFWRALIRGGVKVQISMFIAAFLADLLTYVVTALQMTLNVVTANGADFVGSFVDFMSIYAVTQVPLAIVEGIIFAIFAQYLVTSRPDILGIGGAEVAPLDDDEAIVQSKKNVKIYAAAFAAIAIMCIAFLGYGATQGYEFGGSDDSGGEMAEEYEYEPWTNGIWGDYELPGETESLLFAVLAAVGAVIIGYFIGVSSTKKKYHIEDDDEYSSPYETD